MMKLQLTFQKLKIVSAWHSVINLQRFGKWQTHKPKGELSIKTSKKREQSNKAVKPRFICNV